MHTISPLGDNSTLLMDCTLEFKQYRITFLIYLNIRTNEDSDPFLTVTPTYYMLIIWTPKWVSMRTYLARSFIYWGNWVIFSSEDSTICGWTYTEGSYGQWTHLREHHTSSVSRSWVQTLLLQARGHELDSSSHEPKLYRGKSYHLTSLHHHTT